MNDDAPHAPPTRTSTFFTSSVRVSVKKECLFLLSTYYFLFFLLSLSLSIFLPTRVVDTLPSPSFLPTRTLIYTLLTAPVVWLVLPGALILT